jgi:hypothetical protein
VSQIKAGADSTFSASVDAELLRQLVHVDPPILQADLLDPGANSVQAHMTSFGESDAFASDPYPGSLGVAAPGLIDGLLAQSPGIPPEVLKLAHLPAYPLIASSNYPSTPTDTKSAGTVTLTATSGQQASVGTSADGVNSARTSVSVDPATDLVTATGSSTLGGIDLGSVVSIAGIRSSATVRRSPGGNINRSSEFSIASISILGRQLQLTDKGLQLVGLNLPGLSTVTDPVNKLLASVASKGISITLIPSTATPDGIISGGLEVSQRIDTNIKGIVVTVETTYGRVSASVSNTARPPPGDLGGTSTGGGASSLPSSPMPGSSPTGASSGSSGIGSIANAAQPAPNSPLLATPSTPGAGPGSASSFPGTERVKGLVPELVHATYFYWMLVAAGVVLAVMTSLFRNLGVKLLWTS